MKFLVTGVKKGWMMKRYAEEAEKLGHTAEGCYAKDIVLVGDKESFTPMVNDTPLSEYDLIYLCTGVEAKGRWEWYIAAEYLVGNTKTKIVNEVAVDPHMNYHATPSWFFLKQSESDLPYPRTHVIYAKKNIERVAEDLKYPLIMKVGNIHQGKAIHLINNIEEAEKVANDNPNDFYVLREFIPNDGDIRVFCVGYKAIGAMKRIPPKGDFRSNISAGGTGENFDLGLYPEIQELAEKAAKITKVEVAGVDIILNKDNGKPYILEVNVGPQFKGLETYTDANAARSIIEYFERKCEG